MIRIPILTPGSVQAFPPVDRALREPNGLLCAGGDLSVERLIDAYAQGIFPWYNEGEPPLWWSPDPRLVFVPAEAGPNKRLRRAFRKLDWRISADRCFGEVIRACAEPRAAAGGTWISADMIAAYVRLHRHGYAHSIEVWDAQSALIGGIYGVAIGRVFFGESMFSRRSDASKMAFFALCARLRQLGYELLDGQVESTHLLNLGGQRMPRPQFSECLRRAIGAGRKPGPWAEWPDQLASDVLTGD